MKSKSLLAKSLAKLNIPVNGEKVRKADIRAALADINLLDIQGMDKVKADDAKEEKPPVPKAPPKSHADFYEMLAALAKAEPQAVINDILAKQGGLNLNKAASLLHHVVRNLESIADHFEGTEEEQKMRVSLKSKPKQTLMDFIHKVIGGGWDDKKVAAMKKVLEELFPKKAKAIEEIFELAGDISNLNHEMNESGSNDSDASDKEFDKLVKKVDKLVK